MLVIYCPIEDLDPKILNTIPVNIIKDKNILVVLTNPILK
jgi:hypothetical protein